MVVHQQIHLICKSIINHCRDSHAHLLSKNDVSKQAKKSQAWLKAEVGKKFKYERNQMAHGKQDDTI